MLKQLLDLLGKKRAAKLWFLTAGMFVGSLLELLGISLILSVCYLLADKEALSTHRLAVWACEFLGIAQGNGLAIMMVVMLIGVYLLRALYLALETYKLTAFVKEFHYNLTAELYEGLLHGPYCFFAKSNAAGIMALLGENCHQTVRCLENFLQVMTDCLILLSVGFALLTLYSFDMLFILAGFAALLFWMQLLLRKRVYQVGRVRRTAIIQRKKLEAQAVYGIKEIKVGQTESFFCKHFKAFGRDMIRADFMCQMMTRIPRLCIEIVIILCILLYLLLLLLTGSDVSAAIPGLVALIFAVFRLMPVCSRIETNLTQMNYAKPFLETVWLTMKQIQTWQAEALLDVQQPCELNQSIMARDITFCYEERKNPVLSHINLEIPIGAMVGIIGPSGAGKTTLIDILLGLLKLQEGVVLADGMNIEECYGSYLQKIMYVPQKVFLIDDTIRNNIAFGVCPEQIDDRQVWNALRQSALADFVETLPDKLDTQVGEDGVRLSGGERQRLGLARALYRKPSVIMFDEATSALDTETEASILDTIRQMKGKQTMVIISHRASVITDCDIVYRVENGTVKRENTDYEHCGHFCGRHRPQNA